MKSVFIRVTLSVGLLALVGLGTVVWLLCRNDPSVKLETVVVAILTNLIASGIAFVVGVIVWQHLRDNVNAEEAQRLTVAPITRTWADYHNFIYPTVDKIPWDELFLGATKIDMLVQGWDGWQKKVGAVLPAFLRRGGVINLILHNPQNKDLRRFHAQRMGRTEEEIINEIKRTNTNLLDVIQATLGPNNQDRLTVHYIDKMNWFCAVRFNTDKLLISLYEHKREQEWGHIDSPSFLIRTNVFGDIGQWFEDEWNFLRDGKSYQTEKAASEAA